MLTFKGRIIWVEAKTKSGFTWYRKTQEWLTGIDLRHFNDYVEVAKETKAPVWLMFLQEGKATKDQPEGLVNPAGLYGQWITSLIVRCHHKHGGMIYWAEGSLVRMCDLEFVPGGE